MDNSDIVVRTIDLPHSIMGFTSVSPDGKYNIYINARHTRIEQERTFTHELFHIKNGDFYSEKPVKEIERLTTC